MQRRSVVFMMRVCRLLLREVADTVTPLQYRLPIQYSKDAQWHNNYFALGKGAKYCDQCLHVCLFVCPFAHIKIHTSKFHPFLYMLPVAVWLGPFLTAVRYVMYFRFCG